MGRVRPIANPETELAEEALFARIWRSLSFSVRTGTLQSTRVRR